MTPHEQKLIDHGWHQVGAGHWMHPGILAGQQRFTTDEAIAHEVKAAKEKSKEPVPVVAEKEDWQEEMRNELGKLRGEAERLDQLLHDYQKDLTDIAAILIPEVVAEGRGFTTAALLDAARKAVEPPPLMLQLKSHAQLDEKTVERLQKYIDEVKQSGEWKKPVILFKDRPVTCSKCERTWEEPESVLVVRCECGAEVDTRPVTLEEAQRLNNEALAKHLADADRGPVGKMVEVGSPEEAKELLGETRVIETEPECAGCKKLGTEVKAALLGWSGANEETDQHKAKLREVVVENTHLRSGHKAVVRRIVNVLCHGTTCLISGRDEQVEQIVLSALQYELTPDIAAFQPCKDCSVIGCLHLGNPERVGHDCGRIPDKAPELNCRDCGNEECWPSGILNVAPARSDCFKQKTEVVQLCADCSHQDIRGDQDPCPPCVGDLRKPNFKPKLAPDKPAAEAEKSCDKCGHRHDFGCRHDTGCNSDFEHFTPKAPAPHPFDAWERSVEDRLKAQEEWIKADREFADAAERSPQEIYEKSCGGGDGPCELQPLNARRLWNAMLSNRMWIIDQHKQLKAQEESITQIKNDLYPIEHPNRKAVDESEGK